MNSTLTAVRYICSQDEEIRMFLSEILKIFALDMGEEMKITIEKSKVQNENICRATTTNIFY